MVTGAPRNGLPSISTTKEFMPASEAERQMHEREVRLVQELVEHDGTLECHERRGLAHIDLVSPPRWNRDPKTGKLILVGQ